MATDPAQRAVPLLLSKTPPAAIGRVLLTRQPLSAGLWRGLPWGPADRWLYALATRLLWLYAEAHGDAEVLALGEPALGNPPPVLWRGEVISQDLANCSLEVAAMRRALEGPPAPTWWWRLPRSRR